MDNYPLIAPETACQWVPAFRNIDEAFWSPAIIQAQMSNIRTKLDNEGGCLCSPLVPSFYDELCSQTESETLTVANAKFVNEYLAPAISNYAFGVLASQNVMKVANVGNIQPSGDGQSVSPTALPEYFRRSFAGQGDDWMNTAIIFLKRNLASYPTYEAQIKAGQAPVNNSQSTGGLFIWPENRC